MSGGSYDYLCFQDESDLLHRADDVQRMAERLEELGHSAAARATEEIRVIMTNYRRVMGARLEELQRVWRAVEWHDSHDISRDDVDEAVRDWINKLGV